MNHLRSDHVTLLQLGVKTVLTLVLALFQFISPVRKWGPRIQGIYCCLVSSRQSQYLTQSDQHFWESLATLLKMSRSFVASSFTVYCRDIKLMNTMSVCLTSNQDIYMAILQRRMIIKYLGWTKRRHFYLAALCPIGEHLKKVHLNGNASIKRHGRSSCLLISVFLLTLKELLSTIQ